MPVRSNEHDGIARVTKDRVTRASQNERLTHSVQLRGLIATVAQVTGYFEQFGITMPQRCGLDLKLNSGRNKSLPLARLCCVLRSADSNSFHRVWRATALRLFFITTLVPINTRQMIAEAMSYRAGLGKGSPLSFAHRIASFLKTCPQYLHLLSARPTVSPHRGHGLLVRTK